MKTLPEEVLDKLATEVKRSCIFDTINHSCFSKRGHREFFEAEFHFEENEKKSKEEKKAPQRKPKMENVDEFEFKPNVTEVLNSMTSPSKIDNENDLGDDSDNNGDDSFNPSDPEGEEDENMLSVASNFDYVDNPVQKDDCKLEEEEVKMEVQSNSEQEEEEDYDEDKLDEDSDQDEEERSSDPPRHKQDPTEDSTDRTIDPKLEVKTSTELDEKPVGKQRRGPRPQGPACCDECGKMFDHASDLEKHMVTHTGARDYKCDICTESFPLLNILTRWGDLFFLAKTG